MASRQDDWEKLVHIAEEYEPDPDLGNRTVQELERPPVKKRKKWSLSRWLSIAACCLVVIGLSVFLPVYFSSRNEIIYYSSGEMEISNVSNIEDLQKELNFDFHYYSAGTLYSRIGRIIETGKVAYFEQEGFYLIDNESAVDIINLKIVLLQNADFEFTKTYNDATQSMTVSDVAVSYYIRQSESSSECLAKFTYENVDYYMTITTSNGSAETIENYVELLLGI